jgi:putative hydrolase of the HAD superfamily
MHQLGQRVVSALEPREDQSALEFTQRSLLRLMEDSLGLRFTVSDEEMEWAFWDAALKARLIDGVQAMLAVLSAAGIRMGVVSNSSFARATLERELRRQGVLGRFQMVISSADYGVRKPDPIIFEAALARLGCRPERAWFAGDSVGFDIVGARGAGIHPVAFRPRAAVPPAVGAHSVISAWSELPLLIAAAES